MNLLLLLTAGALAPLAHPTAPLASPSQESAQRPGFAFLRQVEDWSDYRPDAEGPDLLDRIKHIDLSDDGHVWVGFGGRLEARLESWRNFAFLGSTVPVSADDQFVVSRALVHADLHIGDNLRAFVEGKSAQSTDRDLPGGRRPLDLDTLALQQAFIDLTFGAGDGTLRVRPGRQMLLFGAQRLVSPLPWGNTLRTWDGVTVELRSGRWSVQGLATWSVPVDKTEFNTPSRGTPLYGLYARRAPVAGGRGLELYGLGNERSGVTINGTSGNEQRRTFGARSWGPLSASTDLEVEAAWQTGEVGSGDVRAWFAALEAGWTRANLPGAPRFWIGVDAASGDDAPGGDVGTFHQLFPLGHAYLGYADFVGRQNSLDLSVGTTWTLSPATSISLDLHRFEVLETGDALYAASGAPLRTGFTSKNVGTEIDLLVRSTFDRHTSGYLGYSHVFTADAIEQSGPSADVDFAYAGVSFTF